MDLYWAALDGNVEVVRLLLNKDADVNAQRGMYGNALQAAAFRGRTEIVQLLLDKNADVNAQGGMYGNALQAAVNNGQTEIVRLLLDKNANVNAQGGMYGNALYAAVCSGRTEIVRLLLDKNANVNAQGGMYGNALQAAVYGDNAEIVRMLLDAGVAVGRQAPFPNTLSLLHTAILSGNLVCLELLLDGKVQADINVRDAFGRTPLHTAVVEGSSAAVTQLLDHNAQVNTKDFNGLTPIHLAVSTRNCTVALLLFPNDIDGACSVGASAWRSLLPGSEPHLEIADGQPVSISKQLESTIRQKAHPLFQDATQVLAKKEGLMATVLSRRIFLLADGTLLSPGGTGVRCRSWCKVQRDQALEHRHAYGQGKDWIWTIQSNAVPDVAALGPISPENCFVECCFTISAIALPNPNTNEWPQLSTTSEVDIGRLERTFGISWIMVKRHDAEVPERFLRSTMFFSTSEYARVPPRATKLFVPLVQQALRSRSDTLRAAEDRLAIKRTQLLRANGRNPHLVRDLLGDAQLWDLLSRSCIKQIADLKMLNESCKSQAWAVLLEFGTEHQAEQDSDLELLKDTIIELEKSFLTGLKSLRETTDDLVHLEFNLVSIAEAQKSTSTNKSLKRLSWITFVFLPLMFISSLFGMNVDVLESNPSWWFYIPLAVSLMIVTLAVWLIFKYNPGLEDKVERVFNRLARRSPPQDLEQGYSQGLSPQQRAAMFSAFGKKRS